MREVTQCRSLSVRRGGLLALSLLGGVALLLILMSSLVSADPIEPPAGYPKLGLSVKTVSPTLASPGALTLTYAVELRNTGAYTAEDVLLTDAVTGPVVYNGDAWASAGAVTATGSVLTWEGDVGFDATVLLTFSATLDPAFTGTLRNTAVISHVSLTEPLSVTAETVVTDRPILEVTKSALPLKPGPNKPLDYTLRVTNWGQPAADLLITVVDVVPLSTTVNAVGPDGVDGGDVVTWTRAVTLALGEFTEFTFTVDVGDVPAETPIVNDLYYVSSPETELARGEVYTVTIVDPDLRLSKRVMPDPPGSNRDLLYTLRLFNAGSLATDLVITDVIPAGVAYLDDGVESGGVVSWALPRLDTGEFALFTYTGSISDVLHIPLINDDYAACASEGVCALGEPLTSEVEGPIFEVTAWLDPIAKKPGGGSDPELLVTPTVVIRNLGPGNAIDALAQIGFGNISIANNGDLDWSSGTMGERYACGLNRCFDWGGSLSVGDAVTITVIAPQSTMGGSEGNFYTVTAVITDMLSGRVTDPVSDTAIGKITHLAYLQPAKSAPTVIGRGQRMTYTLDVQNTALANDAPPYPVLYDFLPMSMTVITVSHGGQLRVITGSNQMRAITWTLPALGTGEALAEPRWFVVEVDRDVVSGTQLVNEYRTMWYENDATLTGWLSATGQPLTTTVVEVGLIDSFKEVTPTLLTPGVGNVLTYVVHVVNSGPVPLSGVKLYDMLPWQMSTYQRDAVATSGSLVSDIVSLEWNGAVGPFAEELITLTVLVDEDYEGPVTNTAIITHPDLLLPVEVEAIAYVTTQPVLVLTKSATPNPALPGEPLLYTLRVQNLGQQATELVVTDTLPSNVTFDAVYNGGTYDEGANQVRWTLSDLGPGEMETVQFQAVVGSGARIVNADYAVTCAEGVIGIGAPQITLITSGIHPIYLPLVLRAYPAQP